MELAPDAYEYLTNFADDKTILNMLSTNRKFNDDIFFERVMRRKYPLLVRFKKEDETWKEYFLKMTYYIAKIEEEFGVPYISASFYRPNAIYPRIKDIKDIILLKINDINPANERIYKQKVKSLTERMNRSIYNRFVIAAAAAANKDLVELLFSKGSNQEGYALKGAAQSGNIDFFNYILGKIYISGERGKDMLESAYRMAERKGDTNMMNFIQGEIDKR